MDGKLGTIWNEAVLDQGQEINLVQLGRSESDLRYFLIYNAPSVAGALKHKVPLYGRVGHVAAVQVLYGARGSLKRDSFGRSVALVLRVWKSQLKSESQRPIIISQVIVVSRSTPKSGRVISSSLFGTPHIWSC